MPSAEPAAGLAAAPSLPGPSGRARVAWWVVVVVLAAGYAALRLTMNEQYKVAPWPALVELRAPLPFGHRVLVPLLTRPLLATGLPLPLALGIWEAVSAAGLVAAVAWCLRPRLGERLGMVVGLAVLMVLPWPYLLPHRWPIFYPWDTPAMALLVAGVGAIDRQRWGWAMAITLLAALNRESAILLPAAALLLAPPRPGRGRPELARVAGLLAVVLVTRTAIAMALPDNPGPPLHFTVSGHYRVLHNLRWLSDPLHLLVTLPSLAAWPLLWPMLAGSVEPRWRRMWLLAWGQTAGLLVLANIYEPRAFGEVLVLAVLPTAIGVARWLGLIPQAEPRERPAWLRLLDRHGAWLVALAFALFVLALRQWEFLPVAQWPMPRR
ncbi:MAG: hypothetical protein KC501_08950 [Myxococcales bacterium]|nr:hypothetical protein [Myxococcales bacterium]